MVAFPDDPRTTRSGEARDARVTDAAQEAPRRAALAFLGVGLCLAAPGLWLVPSADPVTQLMKLCVSVFLVGMGLHLLLRRRDGGRLSPEAGAPAKGPRVREYDARGRAILRTR